MTSILDTSLDLLKMRSTSDKPEELQKAFVYACDFFADVPGLIVRTYEKNGKPSLVVSTQDTLTPDVLMVGHLDVVPGDDVLFDPKVTDGILVGRGACDMKTEDAVMMHVMRDLAQDANPPSVALMLTTDEEIGGANGVGYLVDEVGYRCKVALVPDGGGEHEEDVMIASKGAAHLRVTARGVSTHGSVPWEGENAIDKLIRSYQRIQALFPEADPQEHWHTTCNIGTIQGGRATNQVPDTASCALDIRHPESTNHTEILKQVQAAASECAVDTLVAVEASATSMEDPFVTQYAQVLKETKGLEVQACRNHSAHDGRFLTHYGIPVIVSRPRSGGQHTDGEWMDVKSLENFHQLYLAFIRSVR